MPGPLDGLKSRKRKSSSEAQSSAKASAPRRRLRSGPKTHRAEGSSALTGPTESPSDISCECQQSQQGRTRCSASPKQLEGREEKENERRAWLGAGRCFDKRRPADMECEGSSKHLYPDDDSNDILPVEQFFGNLDSVQDFPQRAPVAPRESRRRHFYAAEDSDEEQEALGIEQQQPGHTGDSQ